ncbi:hypothetical protein BH10BAC5_BH10BAC5_01660 [soil metagenome]
MAKIGKYHTQVIISFLIILCFSCKGEDINMIKSITVYSNSNKDSINIRDKSKIIEIQRKLIKEKPSEKIFVFVPSYTLKLYYENKVEHILLHGMNYKSNDGIYKTYTDWDSFCNELLVETKKY